MTTEHKDQPVTDDADLAEVLAGMNNAAPQGGGLQFEESPIPQAEGAATGDAQPSTPPAMPTPIIPDTPAADAAPVLAPSFTPPAGSPSPAESPAAPSMAPVTGGLPSTNDPQLDSLKQSALSELRPLVDKLNLPSNEKFDTLLLIIRSTDDKSLLSAAYDAARAIDDETKRAQALLDVIKEIDYFATQKAA